MHLEKLDEKKYVLMSTTVIVCWDLKPSAPQSVKLSKDGKQVVTLSFVSPLLCLALFHKQCWYVNATYWTKSS